MALDSLRQPLIADNTTPSLTNTWTEFKANLDQLTNYKNERY